MGGPPLLPTGPGPPRGTWSSKSADPVLSRYPALPHSTVPFLLHGLSNDGSLAISLDLRRAAPTAGRGHSTSFSRSLSGLLDLLREATSDTQIEELLRDHDSPLLSLCRLISRCTAAPTQTGCAAMYSLSSLPSAPCHRGPPDIHRRRSTWPTR